MHKICVKAKLTKLTYFEFVSACGSLWALEKDLCASNPDWRDEQYKDGRKGNLKVDVVRELILPLLLAKWTYDCSRDCLPDSLTKKFEDKPYEVIDSGLGHQPGQVGYYMARSDKSKIIIIGVKGTSDRYDIANDINMVLTQRGEMHCHNGVLIAAIWLADVVEDHIQHECKKKGYHLVICGHSLGGGTAAVLGLELKSRLGDFDMRFVTFGTPPVVDLKTVRACDFFVTLVVNGADGVPRSSLANLAVMHALLQ